MKRESGICPDRQAAAFITQVESYFRRVPMSATTLPWTGLPSWINSRFNTGDFVVDHCLVLEVIDVMEIGFPAMMLEELRIRREVEMFRRMGTHQRQGLPLTLGTIDSIYQDLPHYPSQTLKMRLSDGHVSFSAYTEEWSGFNLAFFQVGTKVKSSIAHFCPRC